MIRWLICSAYVMLISWLLPGIDITSFGTALLVSLVIGVLNLFIRPLMIFLTIPITIVTFGIFLLFIGLVGAILPIIPGLIFCGIGLTLLEDILFFNNLKNKIEYKIKSIFPTPFKSIKKQVKEILT